MRILAIIPIVLSAAALVLSFLCLFAGSRKGFMEDYALVTLNTSRIGVDLANDTSSSSSSSGNPITDWLHNVTTTIENEIEEDINSVVQSIAKDLGLHDFYSYHILDYCEGFYTPAAVPNATLEESDIHKNITNCSQTTALYNFDPRNVLQAELNKTGHSNVNLATLDWPEAIDKGLRALHVTAEAMFILYCIAIGFIGIALILAIIGLLLDGRLSAFVNLTMDLLALLAVGLASALATAVSVKGAHVINKYGHDFGISGSKSSKFLAITWVATAIMLVASFVWCVDCILGRRRGRASRKYA